MNDAELALESIHNGLKREPEFLEELLALTLEELDHLRLAKRQVVGHDVELTLRSRYFYQEFAATKRFDRLKQHLAPRIDLHTCKFHGAPCRTRSTTHAVVAC